MLQRTEIRATGHVVNETKDLIVRQIGKGRKKSKVLNFSLAVNNYAAKQAAPEKRASSFYRVSAWNEDAELLAQYLRICALPSNAQERCLIHLTSAMTNFQN